MNKYQDNKIKTDIKIETKTKQISKRLKAIATFVDKDDILVDVGTDHGYVPIYLIENGIINKAIAADINNGPLLIAKKNIEEKGLGENINLRLSDGLLNIKPGEADTILVAGMGGNLIINILKEGSEVLKSAKTLILSPHSEWYAVRRYLFDNLIVINEEKMIVDEGKYYLILKCALDSNVKENEEFEDDFELYMKYGKKLIENKDVVLKQYLLKEQKKFDKILINIEKDSKRAKEIKIEQDFINKALELF